MENGFLFIFFDRLFRVLRYCNLVEAFKWAARLIVFETRSNQSKKPSDLSLRTASNVAIDIYNIFKFGIVAVLWAASYDGLLGKYFVAYLIFMNLFSYFYHQVWGSSHVQKSDRDTDNMRFMRTLLGIIFYLFAYAYLFEVHYSTTIAWPAGQTNTWDAIYLSLANAFNLPLAQPPATDLTSRMIFVSEVLNTFLFFIIILTNAIPNHINKGD